MERELTELFVIQPDKLYVPPTNFYKLSQDANAQAKLYPVQNKTTDSLSQVYHSQLAASLKAFQDKKWRPLNENRIEPMVLRCRPQSSASSSRPKSSICKGITSSMTPTPNPPSRPRSVPSDKLQPTNSYRRPETPEVKPGKFDTLDPEILAKLIGKERPESVYGERCVTDQSDVDASDEDVCSASGIDSDASTLENGVEPEVDSDRKVPDLNLRPETLDAIYVPEDRKERKRYDFDANNVDIPPYEFQCPIPKAYQHLEFSIIAKQGLSWRSLTEMPQSKNIERFFDRLISLEKMQQETVESEIRVKSRPQSRRQLSSRTGSAKSRDKRCSNSCLQLACVGDCPDKTANDICKTCLQTFCNGSCLMSYEQHMRQPRTEEAPKVAPRQNPRCCSSCLKKHTAKFINANNTLLGRPRSGNATFSRGINYIKPRDLRPKSAAVISSTSLQQLEDLGIEPCQSTSRPSTAMSGRPRSRNGLLPGKSFSSNRKCSITDPRPKSTIKVRSKSATVRLRSNMTPS
ncbi:hypothetical protein SNE40_008411 [Patella caerulea]|uniref:Uncharacterized protein n=1 Tax=Patella caerulea TaxID=87958 RepID=A0AAN8K5K6_PATCE